MRPPHYLVVNCGSSHISAVHLSMNSSGRCELVDYVIKEIEVSLTDPLLWLKACSRSFNEIRTRFKNDMPVGFGLPGNLFLTKYLKIPQGPLKKRQKTVAFEARQNIPYPIAEVAWDDCVIDEDDLDFETLIAASKTELVESLSRYGRESKMDPDIIEPTFLGLINGFRFNEPHTSGCTLMISIGSKSTDIVFYDGNRFYSRNVSLGGNALTQEIRSLLDLPFVDAEKIKRAAIAGEPIPTGEYAAFVEAKENFLKRLHIEISRTKAIYKNHGDEEELSQCRLSGGGALLPGIETALSDRLGIPVERFDALKQVHVASNCPSDRLEKDRAFLNEAIGIAIGRFLPDSPEVNLLPRSILWQRKFKRQQPYYVIAGLVACAAVAMPLVNTIISVQRYEQEIQNLDTKIAPLRELNTKINLRIEKIEKLEKIINESTMVAESRSNWMLFLNDIQSRLAKVEDVWLDKIEVVRPEVRTVSASNRFNERRGSEPQSVDRKLKLKLEGRLLDVSNPLSMVSQESNRRVAALLESFSESEFIEGLEEERFDNNVPGILKFNFTLVVDSARPL